MILLETILILACFKSYSCDERLRQQVKLLSSKLNKNGQYLHNNNMCIKLDINRVFFKKSIIDKKLLESIKQVESDVSLSDKIKVHRVQVINILQREMNDSVTSLYNSIDNLQHLLSGDYKSIQQLKETSTLRLEQLKTSMLNAEEEYKHIINAEKEEQSNIASNGSSNNDGPNRNVLKRFVDDLIKNVAVAADELEEKFKNNDFENKIHDNSNKINIETVIKVGGEEKGKGDDNEGVVMIVDSESNHFVLSKPKDSTTTHVDHVLIKDIILITIVAFLFMVCCNLLTLPTLFAYILTGILLGPSGYDYLKSIVQVETIGEFGVFLVLFSLGMEFSPDQLRKVFRLSVVGAFSCFTLFVFIGLFWGAIYGIKPHQSFFVSLSLSFSSTPMIIKLLAAQRSRRDHEILYNNNNDDYSNLLVSMLFLQDATLGLFMAVLPILAGHSTEKSHSFAKVSHNAVIHRWFHGAFAGPWEVLFFTLFELTLALAAIFFFTYVVSKYVAAKFFRGLNLTGSPETYVIGILSAVFLMLYITGAAGISTELGCFICGGIIGTIGEPTSKQVLSVVQPLKDFFSALFFASIGFHIFPSFVLSEILIFIPITITIIATKILPKGSKSKWLVAAGLSQLSEFSFVLGSRARRYGLVGREVYLTILSVTTLSLLFAPFMWRSVHSTVVHGTTLSLPTLVKKLKGFPQ